MRLVVLLQALLSLVGGPSQAEREVALLTPREKAALVVVSGLPAPAGVAGVIVRRWDRQLPRPAGALVFVDQEGGLVKAYPELPPWASASALGRVDEALAAGLETGRALRDVGVNVDLAPVLDSRDGPLGSRQFRRPELALAFGRGLGRAGMGACAKHFPGLGSTAVSTDRAHRVRGVLRSGELAGFFRAARVLPCVMVGHAVYPAQGSRSASFSPWAYRLLRDRGFDGIAITDSLGVFGSDLAPYWATSAIRAGADLVLFTKAADAERAIHALVPLARRGELDESVTRVLQWRRSLLGPGR